VRKKDGYNEFMREYMLRRYHTRRAEAVERLGGKCKVCGTVENLEIDHVDRTTKTMNVNRMCSVSRPRFEAELELCQLLCREHHKQKSDQEQSVNHGEGKTGKRNCRCELCGPLKREYARQWKRNNAGR
jgi:hypothetical protein